LKFARVFSETMDRFLSGAALKGLIQHNHARIEIVSF
jgi:hypothetical protein